MTLQEIKALKDAVDQALDNMPLQATKTQIEPLPDPNEPTIDPAYQFCPRCNSPLRPTQSLSGSPSTDWLECSSKTCNTFVDTYKPMPHQTAVHLHRGAHHLGAR